MFRTFKGNLIVINPPNALGEKLIADGIMWHLGQPVKDRPVWKEIFEFTQNEILFNFEQQKIYGDKLSLNPFDTKFYDGINYQLNKHYKRGQSIYEIKIDIVYLRLQLNWWNKIKLNIIHNRYWLFNEKKWFITFLLSLAAFILSIISLIMNK